MDFHVGRTGITWILSGQQCRGRNNGIPTIALRKINKIRVRRNKGKRLTYDKSSYQVITRQLTIFGIPHNVSYASGSLNHRRSCEAAICIHLLSPRSSNCSRLFDIRPVTARNGRPGLIRSLHCVVRVWSEQCRRVYFEISAAFDKSLSFTPSTVFFLRGYPVQINRRQSKKRFRARTLQWGGKPTRYQYAQSQTSGTRNRCAHHSNGPIQPYNNHMAAEPDDVYFNFEYLNILLPLALTILRRRPPKSPSISGDRKRFVLLSDTHTSEIVDPDGRGDVLLHSVGPYKTIKELMKTMAWLYELLHPVKMYVSYVHPICTRLTDHEHPDSLPGTMIWLPTPRLERIAKQWVRGWRSGL
ncbi:hypothetical protein B0H10DRAFT_1939210 [Mycena sp. CBHHK59/15]|nr:hypothetical protein B0H10DRAFT_1939210 [Mycena sp. CBHHK59/15]